MSDVLLCLPAYCRSGLTIPHPPMGGWVIPARKIRSQGVNHRKSRRKYVKTEVTGHGQVQQAYETPPAAKFPVTTV